MTRTISLVQTVSIAAPCSAKWDDMAGDDRSRFCSHCQLNVYNLSAMTEEEGERLIIEKEGKLCARIYRRADGTVITRDCPVGLAAIRRRFVGFAARTAAKLMFLVSALAQTIYARNHDHLDRFPQFRPTVYGQTTTTMKRWFATTTPPPRLVPFVTSGVISMGKPAYAPQLQAGTADEVKKITSPLETTP